MILKLSIPLRWRVSAAITPVIPPPRIRTWKSLGSETWLCCVGAAMPEAMRDGRLESPSPSGVGGRNIRTIDRSRLREVVRE